MFQSNFQQPQQQPQQQGGLFGAQPQQSTNPFDPNKQMQQGLFGQPAQQQQQSQVFGQQPSMMGGQQQKPPGQSLFGGLGVQPAASAFGQQPQQQQQQPGGGLFGNTNPNPAPTAFGQQPNTGMNPNTGMIANAGMNPNQPKPAGGLFGSIQMNQPAQQQTGGGLFGSTAPQQNSQMPFGNTPNPAISNPTGGIFGQSTQPAQLGQPQQQQQPFQSGTLFGPAQTTPFSGSIGFGGVQTQQSQSQPGQTNTFGSNNFQKPLGSFRLRLDKNNIKALPRNVENNDKLDKKNIAVLSVNYCTEFRGMSLEEIRAMDYQAVKNNQVPEESKMHVQRVWNMKSQQVQEQFGQQGGGMMQQPGATSGQGGLFNAAGSSQPPAGGGGLFGQVGNNNGMMQQPNSQGPQGLNGFSLSGNNGQQQPQQTGGLFGQTQPQQQPGQTAGGLFGGGGQQSQPQNGQPGASTPFNPFNASTPSPAQAPAKGGLFGQPAFPQTNSTFPPQQTQQQGGGLFGQTQTQQPQSTQPATGGLFGGSAAAQPATGGLFNQAPANPAPASGGLFGSTAPPANTQPATGGLFGGTSMPATQQPATGGLFGGSTAPATGGLFGGSTAPNNSQPATGGLFGGSTAPATGGLFGGPTAGASGGLFGGSSQQQQNKPMASNLNTQATGDPHMQNLLTIQSLVGSQQEGSMRSFGYQGKDLYPGLVTGKPVRSNHVYNLPPQADYYEGLHTSVPTISLPAKHSQKLIKQRQKAINSKYAWKKQQNQEYQQGKEEEETPSLKMSSQLIDRSLIDRSNVMVSRGAMPVLPVLTQTPTDESSVTLFMKYRQNMEDPNSASLQVPVEVEKDIEVDDLKSQLSSLIKMPAHLSLGLSLLTNEVPQLLADDSRLNQYVLNGQSTLLCSAGPRLPVAKIVPKQKQPERAAPDVTHLLPQLTKEGYSTSPSRHELAQMTPEQLKSVPNFTIENDWACIAYTVPVDVTYVNLDEIVTLKHKVIAMYDGLEEHQVPKVGEKLNNRAVLTYKHYEVPLVQGQKMELQKFIVKMIQTMHSQEMQFVSYDQETNMLRVEVDHF